MSSRPTPPSNAPTSSSRRPSSCASFLDRHKDRIAVLGGLTLIDDDPDYLSIAPDLTFRSRSRYLDDVTGEWVSETEVIESASELVELYNPADIYAAFAEAAREAAGLAGRADRRGRPARGRRDLARRGRLARRGPVRRRRRLVGGRPADLARARTTTSRPRAGCTTSRSSTRNGASAARRACSTSSRAPSAGLVAIIGDLIIVDDDDERLIADGRRASAPRSSRRTAEDEWRTLSGADELVEFYDPTDVFGDLADALAEAFPAVAPELAGDVRPTGPSGTRRRCDADADERRRSRRPTTRPTTPRTSRPRDDAARRG